MRLNVTEKYLDEQRENVENLKNEDERGQR